MENYLDSKILHLGWRQESFDDCHNGPVSSGHDQGLPLPHASVQQDNVDGCSQAWDSLNFENGSLELLGEG